MALPTLDARALRRLDTQHADDAGNADVNRWVEGTAFKAGEMKKLRDEVILPVVTVILGYVPSVDDETFPRSAFPRDVIDFVLEQFGGRLRAAPHRNTTERRESYLMLRPNMKWAGLICGDNGRYKSVNEYHLPTATLEEWERLHPIPAREWISLWRKPAPFVPRPREARGTGPPPPPPAPTVATNRCIEIIDVDAPNPVPPVGGGGVVRPLPSLFTGERRFLKTRTTPYARPDRAAGM